MAINMNNYIRHARDLSKEIEDDLNTYNKTIKHSGNRPPHLKILSETMKRYFERELVIIYKWRPDVKLPYPSTDPFIRITSRVKFPVFNLYPSRTLEDVARYIQQAFIQAAIVHPKPWNFEMDPSALGGLKRSKFLCPTLPPIKEVKTEDDNIYRCIAEPTCRWVATSINNPEPIQGSPKQKLFMLDMRSVMQDKSIVFWPDPAYVAGLLLVFNEITESGMRWKTGETYEMQTTFREPDWKRLPEIGDI